VLYNISGLSCIAEHDGFDKKKKNDFDGSERDEFRQFSALSKLNRITLLASGKTLSETFHLLIN